MNIRAFPISLEDRREVRTAIGTSGSPNGGRGAELAVSLRAVHPFGYSQALQVVVGRGLHLFNAHIPAQPMLEFVGLEQDRHTVMDFRHELIWLADNHRARLDPLARYTEVILASQRLGTASENQYALASPGTRRVRDSDEHLGKSGLLPFIGTSLVGERS
jgi:hypothetical protein